MKLYGYWRSTSTWRVRIGLSYKSIEHEYVPVDLGTGEQTSAEFLRKNPLGQVPVLEITDGDRAERLTQSLPILEFLEERFRERPLLPGSAVARAQVREYVEMVNSGIQPLQNLAVVARIRDLSDETRAADWTRYYIERGLRAMEEKAQSNRGKYLVGDSATLADVFLVPQMYNARRFGVDVTPFTTLRRIDEECRKLPSFTESHPDAQPDAVKD